VHGIVLANLERFLRGKGVRSATPRSYSEDAVYDDAELESVLSHGVGHLSRTTREQLLEEFGRYLALETFPSLVPDFYERHKTFQSCLLSVEDQIHTVVRRALPGAAPPHLRVSALGEAGVVIAYTSARKLCPLLHGLIAGTAEKYDTTVEVTETLCALRGDPWCSLIVQAEPE
jgi:predicted hydrocarbon binding protein